MKQGARTLIRLQGNIESLNDTETGFDVRHFLVDAEMRAELLGEGTDIPEQLLVTETDEDVLVGVYLHDTVLEQLEAMRPLQSFTWEALEPLCLATEGISHFVFLSWCSQRDRAVSALELEIQAEVDKFLMLWFLLKEDETGEYVADLLSERLFRDFEIRDAVPADQVERYRVANTVAERFCRELGKRFSKRRDEAQVRKAARMFVRRGLQQKLVGLL